MQGRHPQGHRGRYARQRLTKHKNRACPLKRPRHSTQRDIFKSHSATSLIPLSSPLPRPFLGLVRPTLQSTRPHAPVPGFGSRWVLQELMRGVHEYSTSLLVVKGEIIDSCCTRYEYDEEEYVWPRVNEIGWKRCVGPPRSLVSVCVVRGMWIPSETISRAPSPTPCFLAVTGPAIPGVPSARIRSMPTRLLAAIRLHPPSAQPPLQEFPTGAGHAHGCDARLPLGSRLRVLWHLQLQLQGTLAPHRGAFAIAPFAIAPRPRAQSRCRLRARCCLSSFVNPARLNPHGVAGGACADPRRWEDVHIRDQHASRRRSAPLWLHLAAYREFPPAPRRVAKGFVNRSCTLPHTRCAPFDFARPAPFLRFRVRHPEAQGTGDAREARFPLSVISVHLADIIEHLPAWDPTATDPTACNCTDPHCTPPSRPLRAHHATTRSHRTHHAQTHLDPPHRTQPCPRPEPSPFRVALKRERILLRGSLSWDSSPCRLFELSRIRSPRAPVPTDQTHTPLRVATSGTYHRPRVHPIASLGCGTQELPETASRQSAVYG